MIRQIIISFFVLIVAVSALTFYNYSKAQQNLRQAQPSILSIELGENPSEISRETLTNFKWKVIGPESFSAVMTGIYWGYDSTPSAVTKVDSPKAVGYPNYTDDYSSGRFPLPDTFDVNLLFGKPGVVYYRAYALVGEDHLWSEEQKMLVK